MKGKCLGDEGGLVCNKSHAHEREVISNAADPNHDGASIMSSAVRVVQRLSGDFTWTLWHQSNLNTVVQSEAKGKKHCVRARMRDGGALYTNPLQQII